MRSGGDRTVRIWRREATTSADAPLSFTGGAPLRNHAHIVWQCSFSVDGSRFATVSEDGTCVVFAVDSGDEVACFAPTSGMRAVCFVGNDAVICGGGDGTMFFVDLLSLRA